MNDSGESVGARRVWPPLVLAGAVLGVWALRRGPELLPEPTEDEPQVEVVAAEQFWPYHAEARALLGGLDAGDSVAEGWEVSRVEGPLPDGRIKLSCARGSVTLAVWVVPRGLSSHAPPVETGSYALFYDRPHPPGAAVDEAAITELLAAVAARVSAHEPGG